jgi:soluble lytic murein transglycosylase
VTFGLGFRGTSLAVGIALTCAGLATAQSLTGDSPMASVSGPVANDTPSVGASLSAAKSGDASRLRAILDQTTDPLARKVALWAMADAVPEGLTWQEADAARRDLGDWPRPSRRQVAAERLLDRSGLSPAQIIAWFGKDDPLTAQGAMALADAQRMTGQPDEAATTVRRAWRTLAFDQVTQEGMLARFSTLLTEADHEAREDFLLYGAQGPAAQDLLRLLPPGQQAVAEARMAVRRGDSSAPMLIAALPPADQTSPGLIYERVLAARDHGDIAGALALIPYLPAALPDESAAKRLWKNGALVVGALQVGDANTAYQVAARSGLTSGPEAAAAQFYAGWIALSRFKDPKLADGHFERVGETGSSPITQSRALYWRGRAAEAEGDVVAAQIFYGQAAKYYTTFYGQLAASKGGKAQLILGHDPSITPTDRAAFEGRDCVRATRLLAGMGNMEAVRTFVIGLSESLPTATDEAMLVDLARGYGEQELSMRVVRNAARRGFILPERGYPIRSAPAGPDSAEAPLVLGVTRQESSFNPSARSGAGARGMMQLLPTTAQNIARRSGLGWGSLDDPDFNMRVGSVYLDQLVNQFSGSYIMAAAAYNAGPGRPVQWVSLCGDPRASSTDPLDFIECIPFSETRDYVMRVLEATQVYRARLNGGVAPVTLALDLKRGSFGYQPGGAVQPVSGPAASYVLAPPIPAGR